MLLNELARELELDSGFLYHKLIGLNIFEPIFLNDNDILEIKYKAIEEFGTDLKNHFPRFSEGELQKKELYIFKYLYKNLELNTPILKQDIETVPTHEDIQLKQNYEVAILEIEKLKQKIISLGKGSAIKIKPPKSKIKKSNNSTKVSALEILSLKEQGKTHPQIALLKNISTTKISKILSEHRKSQQQ